MELNLKRLHFTWRLLATSVTCSYSWFHGCVNYFMAWGLYVAPLWPFVNQNLILIVRHFMPVLKAFIPEMSIEGLRTFFINQYHRFQALRYQCFPTFFDRETRSIAVLEVFKLRIRLYSKSHYKRLWSYLFGLNVIQSIFKRNSNVIQKGFKCDSKRFKRIKK